MKLNIVLLTYLLIPFSLLSAKDYNIKDFGAIADGKTLTNKAFNKALEAASNNGGGRVIVPAGEYLCGSIRMKSNTELHFEDGAKIIAAPENYQAYDKREPWDGPQYQDGGHTFFHNSLIWADGEKNISITGKGFIDGVGLTKKDKEKAGIVEGGGVDTGDKSIAFKLCQNVKIKDITIYRGGHFAIIVTGCKKTLIDSVTIDTNRDGVDIDCCKDLIIRNSIVNTSHDDAIVLKSSYALKKVVPCENVTVKNCTVTGYKCGTYLDGTKIPEPVNWVCGRIKLGTESNGGYRNIFIKNCKGEYSSGLAFESVDQGLMENIYVDGVTINHTHHYPIYITTGCRNRGPKERTDISTGRNIFIKNVTCLHADSIAGIIITGMPGTPLENISLKNITVQYAGGGKAEYADREYREQGTNYPEPKFAGFTPSYGVFARHVRGLKLTNLNFSVEKLEGRPMLKFIDVENVEVKNVNGPNK
jgi:polygalacturonase